jgi:hypothetical protein
MEDRSGQETSRLPGRLKRAMQPHRKSDIGP